MATKYNPTRPANDVAVDGDYCSYCGGDVTVGEPVVRATITLTGRERPNCRHTYDCLAADDSATKANLFGNGHFWIVHFSLPV